MKVLLGNPPCKVSISQRYEKYFIRAGSRWPHSGVKRKGKLPHYLPFPFFLAYTAALLIKEKFGVEVLDGVALDLSQEEFINEIFELNPDVLMFETSTSTIEYDLDLIREIKEKNHPIVIFTGTQATTYASQLLEHHPEIDYIVRGEYEISFLRLWQQLRNGKSFGGLKGIAYRQNGKVVVTKDAPLIDPLDQLPYPARDLFPRNNAPNPTIYWDGFCQNRPAVQLHASRGCTYRCNYCLWNQVMYHEGKYRMFSPRRVVNEMEDAIYKYHAKEIYFDDDDFTISKRHVREICQEIKQKGLKTKWSCMADAVNLDEKVLKEMAESGCIGMKFGVESASPIVLKKLGKPVQLEKIKRAVSIMAHYGIKSHATFCLGMLGETNSTLKETLDFAESLDVDTIQVSICTPYPGTRFYDTLVEKGFLGHNTDWKDYDGKVSTVFNYPQLSQEELSRWRGHFIWQWVIAHLLSPQWFFRQLGRLLATIKGLGMKFFIRQVIGIIEDERHHG